MGDEKVGWKTAASGPLQQLLAPQHDQGRKYSYHRQPLMDVLASYGGVAAVSSIDADDGSRIPRSSAVARKSGGDGETPSARATASTATTSVTATCLNMAVDERMAKERT